MNFDYAFLIICKALQLKTEAEFVFLYHTFMNAFVEKKDEELQVKPFGKREFKKAI